MVLKLGIDCFIGMNIFFPISNFVLDNGGRSIQSGLESTLRADQYSSINIAKFVDSENLQNNVWRDSTLPNNDVSTSQGYKLTKCSSTNTFVAGVVTELDCNDVPSQNIAPVAVDKTIIVGSDPITIPLTVGQPNNQNIEFNQSSNTGDFRLL